MLCTHKTYEVLQEGWIQDLTLGNPRPLLWRIALPVYLILPSLTRVAHILYFLRGESHRFGDWLDLGYVEGKVNLRRGWP